MPEPTYESNYIFPRRMLFFHANRSALLIRGLVFFLIGLVGLFHPVGSMAAITVVLGIFLLLDAMGALFLSIACRRFFGVFCLLFLAFCCIIPVRTRAFFAPCSVRAVPLKHSTSSQRKTDTMNIKIALKSAAVSLALAIRWPC